MYGIYDIIPMLISYYEERIYWLFFKHCSITLFYNFALDVSISKYLVSFNIIYTFLVSV